MEDEGHSIKGWSTMSLYSSVVPGCCIAHFGVGVAPMYNMMGAVTVCLCLPK